MGKTEISYEIPDVDLARPGGGIVNPANFIGHELVILFCPTDPAAAARDVADYAPAPAGLCDSDGWIIGICDDDKPSGKHTATTSFTMVKDRDSLAWSAFQSLLEPEKQDSRRDGAVFLFDRGGGLRRSWTGSGHASDIVRALTERL